MNFSVLLTLPGMLVKKRDADSRSRVSSRDEGWLRSEKSMGDFGVDVLKECFEARRACFLAQDAQGILSFAIPYMKAGLASGEYCLCLVSGPLSARQALRALKTNGTFFDSYLAKKQLEIFDYTAWRRGRAPFSPQKLEGYLVHKGSEAVKAGFKGFRLFRGLNRLAYEDNKVFMRDTTRWQELARNHRMIFADVYLLKLFSSEEISGIIACYPCVSRQQAMSHVVVKSECFGPLSTEAAALKKEMDLVLDVTKTGLDIIDAGFNIRYVNASWAKLYGDYAGKKCYEYFMGRDSICHDCGLKKAFETKQPVVAREVLAREGNRCVEVVTIPFQDEDGEWLAAEVNLDITERLKIEKQLNENREYIELLFNLVPSAVFTLDLERRIVKWNKKAEELTGYSAKEVIGQKCFLFATSPCDEKCGLYSDDIVKPVVKKECSIRRKDGSLRVISKNADLLRDKNGHVIGGIESFEDITQYKRVEEELGKVALEWSKTFNAISDAVFIVNKDFKIVKFNRAFVSMLGIRPEEIIGREYSVLLGIDTRVWPSCFVGANETRKEPLVFEVDNSVISFPLLVSVSPIFDEKDNYTGAIHIVRDISIVKKAQDELKQRLRDLEVFQAAAVGREEKMIELKQKIKELEKELKERR